MKVTDGSDSSSSPAVTCPESNKRTGGGGKGDGTKADKKLPGNGVAVAADDLTSSGLSDESEVESSNNHQNGTTHTNGNGGGGGGGESPGSSDVDVALPNGGGGGKVKTKKQQDKHTSNGKAKNSRNSEDMNGSNNKKSNSNCTPPPVATTTTTTTTTSSDEGEETPKDDDPSGDSPKGDNPEDVFYVHDTGLTIKIVAPGAEPFEIQVAVSSSEIVQELHQLLMEREDTCHRTCFSLQLDGITLDNFAELKSIPGLKDGSVIRVVEEPYTCREARIHVKHVRDLLKPSDWADAYAGADCASLSFLNAVSGGDLSGKKRVVDCTPPDYIMPGTANSLLLNPIHPLNKEHKPISCLKVMAASGWNPPPGYRKLHGDLMYLLVVTLEDKTCHITTSPRGFYLNRSTTDEFDPAPSSPHNFLSHSLIELLNQISPAFRKSFTALQKRRMSRHPFERVATPYQVYSWVSPPIPHNLDAIRAEEAFSSKLGYEEHIPGQTRDWNEELQSTRELPRSTLPERLLRERAIFKVHSDFVSAATRGAVAVIDGNIMAINPGESHKMQMFIWSNIFFSLGFDVRDHYKELGGDAAAHVAPRNDLQGVAAYNAIDLDGLYTLGTVVIDYRGYRVTAQSIIPGILEREQDQSVVYGSIDFGKTVVTNEKYLDLLKKAAPRLKVLPHYVLNEKEEVVELCSSVECKGIIGNDGRHYILDLLRTFPPDANYLPGENVELSEEIRAMGYPMEHPHKLCCLRQELVDAFAESRYMSFIKLAAYHLQTMGLSKKLNIEPAPTTAEGEDASIKGEDGAGVPNQNGIGLGGDEESAKKEENNVKRVVESFVTDKAEESSTVKAIRQAAASVCSLSETEFDIRFNPDIFSPSVRHAEPCAEKLAQVAQRDADREAAERAKEAAAEGSTPPEATESNASTTTKEVAKPKKYPSMDLQTKINKEACEFLLMYQIPQFVRDITSNSGSTFFGPNALIMDGATLSAAMHARGINIRYLGRVVQLLLEREKAVREGASTVVSSVATTTTPNGAAPTTNGQSQPPTQNGTSSTTTNGHLANLPHYMTTIALMELIARAAKHIFNPYVQSVDVMNQSLAISHFLNCLLMSGQSAVPPNLNDELTPLRGSRGGTHRNKSKQNKARNSSSSGNGNGIEWTALTQSSLWEQILGDISTYFGLTFPPGETFKDSLDGTLSFYGIQKISLLRSFTLKTGVQILLREYQFHRNGATSGKSSGNTFTQEDVLNVFPVVKHIDPKASDAYTFLGTAQSKMSSGFFREGYELLSESLNLLNNVYGAMHPDIALCLRSLARLNYVMGEHGDAMAYQQKALFMAERILGVDHPTTILEYTHLALYCFANNQVTTALKLLYRARYLALLVCGENHPHVALLDSNIGLILHAVAEYELSLKFLEKALDLSKKYFGARSLKTAVGHHLVARTQSCIGDFRSALMNERETFSIYREQLGEKHEKTLEASDCLQHLTQQAVVLQRKINDLAHGKGLPPIQIQPPSMGSVLDMLNLINGILFMQISQQDIETFKAELEQRAKELSPTSSLPQAAIQPAAAATVMEEPLD
ncbi:clustered mitochondria protein homolog isoform X3 [Folsomia candida]|uniref:clustered mitochondria protein homolog isoform X3 n=1 Tax=Folsomia candida TaxID=158441 RepID=UPI000B8FCF35|nr:clustered mitochondria protein homolog isoform X3 [Folsomia candida]